MNAQKEFKLKKFDATEEVKEDELLESLREVNNYNNKEVFYFQ